MDRRPNEQYLKDLVFRGGFLVILVYVLVFLYNSGFLSRFTRAPVQAPTPITTPILETQTDRDTYTDYDHVQPESSESFEGIGE